jgi:GntR family transcriptional regulator
MSQRKPTSETNDSGSDDNAALPLYRQVAATMSTAILRGIYPEGTRIPTEDALCRRFDVSRHTVREALRELRANGLITSSPGSRPIVTPPLPPSDRAALTGVSGQDFFDFMVGTRLAIDTAGMATMPRDLAGGADIAGSWLCLAGYRVDAESGNARCWNEYAIAERYRAIGALLARHTGPAVPLLEDMFKVRIATFTRSASAIAMPAAFAARLAAKPRVPALQVVVRCETADGEIAMVTRSIHAAGVFSYVIRR